MNKKQLILTSFVIVLPALIGAFFWKALPEQIPTHFGIDGQADGYSSKVFTLVAFPILFVLFQIIALASLERESVKVTVPAKMRKLYAWIVPALSFIVQGSIYANALGWVKSSPTLVTAFLGIIFIILGNYLPKHIAIIPSVFAFLGLCLMTKIGIRHTAWQVNFGCLVVCLSCLRVLFRWLCLM